MKPRAFLTAILLMLGCAGIHQTACAQSTETPKVEEPKLRPYSMVQIDGPIDNQEVAASWHKQILAAAASHDYVVIEINTPGGRTDIGFFIAKTIEDCGKPTICIVDGFAQSYGFYLLQSCTVRVMTTRSFLMMHESHYTNITIGVATKHELQRYADSLKALDDATSVHYANRMGMPVEQIRERISNRDWYFSADDALKYHAVDFVFKSVQESVKTLEKLIELRK